MSMSEQSCGNHPVNPFIHDLQRGQYLFDAAASQNAEAVRRLRKWFQARAIGWIDWRFLQTDQRERDRLKQRLVLVRLPPPRTDAVAPGHSCLVWVTDILTEFLLSLEREALLDPTRVDRQFVDMIMRAGSVNPEPELHFQWRLESILDELAKLDVEQARIFQLRHVIGLTLQECATAMNLSIDKVRVREEKAKAFVKNQWLQAGDVGGVENASESKP